MNKHVRIIQKDDFTKYGTVEKVDENFVYLKHDNGKSDAISIKFISSITEVLR